MKSAEDLQKRVEKLRDLLKKTTQESESTPTSEKVRKARKKLKRTQRKLRALKRDQTQSAARTKKEGKAAGEAPAS